MSLKLAVATEDFGGNLKRSIGRAATIDVAGVRLNARTELDAMNPSESAVRQVLLYVKERQLKTAGLFCPTRHAIADDQFLEQRIEVIKRSMSLVRQLETEPLIVRCGQIPDPEIEEISTTVTESIDEAANPFSFANTTATRSPAAEFQQLCEVLNDLVAYGNHVGCTLTLQLNEYEARLIQAILSRVKLGPLEFVFDPATAIMTGASVESTYRDLYQHFNYVRARDAVRNVDGAGTEVAVSKGIVDWIRLMPTLDEASFRGWICVERTGGDSRSSDVSTGVSYLNKLIPQSVD